MAGVSAEQVSKGEFVWSELGQMLLICERFGQDPLTWLERAYAAPGNLLDLLAWFDAVRRGSEK